MNSNDNMQMNAQMAEAAAEQAAKISDMAAREAMNDQIAAAKAEGETLSQKWDKLRTQALDGYGQVKEMYKSGELKDKLKSTAADALERGASLAGDLASKLRK